MELRHNAHAYTFKLKTRRQSQAGASGGLDEGSGGLAKSSGGVDEASLSLDEPPEGPADVLTCGPTCMSSGKGQKKRKRKKTLCNF